MNAPPQNPFAGFFSQRPIGPVTKGLMAVTLIASVIFTFSARNGSFGAPDLVFHVDAVLGLEIWRLITYPFIISHPLSLLLSLFILYLFGSHFESIWGSEDFLRFFVFASIGAAALAVPLNLFLGTILPFGDTGVASGPSAVFDALLVAMALTNPNANVLFGFVLPIKARNIIYFILGFELLSGLMTGAAAVSITLGGMAMGYLLVTGNWRPDRILTRLKLWRLRHKRRGLYVVRPQNDQTLH